MILGIDLSAHNASLPAQTFDRLAQHGCRFLFARASIGADVDEHFARFAKTSEMLGWATGGYHFMKPKSEGGSGVQQAETYLRSIDASERGLEAHFLDVERARIPQFQIVQFVERIRREGLRIGGYSRTETFWNVRYPDWPITNGIFDYLWLAEWDTNRHIKDWDTVPHEHAESPLVQFGKIKVPVAGELLTMDGNLYRGTVDGMIAYLRVYG